MYLGGTRQCEISKLLHLTTCNVSRWCRKILPTGISLKPRTKQELDRKYWYTFDIINLEKLSQNDAKLLLSLLYWCEGCKYPGSNHIEFVSSDELMQQAFLKLLRFAYKGELDESKFRVLLQLHTTHNVNQQITYWSKFVEYQGFVYIPLV